MAIALGDRSGFPRLEYSAYLAHSAVAPPSAAVERAMTEAMQAYARQGIGAIFPWIEQREALRADLGRLLGARAADIGFVSNTSMGLNVVANGLRWQRGERIVVFRGEFPTNVFCWQQAARREGLELVWLDVDDFSGAGGSGLTKLEAELKKGVRLVAVSAVQFHTGLRMPVREMAALCRDHGAELCVDAIQAAGICALDVGWGIDYIACGGHKWLGGVEGTAFVYISPERVGQLEPNLGGWLSLEDPIDFLMAPGKLRYDRHARPEASAVEAGVVNVVGYAGLGAAIAPLLELGVPTIHAHVQRYLDDLEPRVEALGLVSVRASEAEQRSGIASFSLPEAVTARIDVGTLSERLATRGVRVSTPDGYLRFAPHWSNGLAEVPLVEAALRECLDR